MGKLSRCPTQPVRIEQTPWLLCEAHELQSGHEVNTRFWHLM